MTLIIVLIGGKLYCSDMATAMRKLYEIENNND
jgi:hypothetical protein